MENINKTGKEIFYKRKEDVKEDVSITLFAL